jgi:hypothetical protein
MGPFCSAWSASLDVIASMFRCPLLYSLLLLVVGFAPTTLGRSIQFSTCQPTSGVVHSVSVDPCASEPCTFYFGSLVTITIDFTPEIDTDNPRSGLQALYQGSPYAYSGSVWWNKFRRLAQTTDVTISILSQAKLRGEDLFRQTCGERRRATICVSVPYAEIGKLHSPPLPSRHFSLRIRGDEI